MQLGHLVVHSFWNNVRDLLSLEISFLPRGAHLFEPGDLNPVAHVEGGVANQFHVASSLQKISLTWQIHLLITRG